MEKSKQFTDQLGRMVEIQFPPKRIISVVPSQTELLHDLGLDEQVVGITKFCIHPKDWYQSKARVGGTKDLDFDKIKALNPDLIIANKEENDQSQIELLAKDYPVWISDINDLSSAINMIRSVAEMCDQSDTGNHICLNVESGFSSLKDKLGSAIYFIWNKPLMVAGSDTFISEMMKKSGFENVVSQARYPELTQGQIQDLNPDFILLSSEPFPFKSEHQKSFQTLFPDSKVILVDGEMFSWYGSRLLKAPDYFKQLAKGLS
ncbi:MAG: ABC-type Fe3+-hydroxamate transport system substrate-binding protein [Bacteroidia bacterium]|jgi:ABC-type Fe3+-hydroxamate transport system substrate-binding protein